MTEVRRADDRTLDHYVSHLEKEGLVPKGKLRLNSANVSKNVVGDHSDMPNFYNYGLNLDLSTPAATRRKASKSNGFVRVAQGFDPGLAGPDPMADPNIDPSIDPNTDPNIDPSMHSHPNGGGENIGQMQQDYQDILRHIEELRAQGGNTTGLELQRDQMGQHSENPDGAIYH